MPAVCDVPLHLNVEQMLRRRGGAGYRPQLQPQATEMLHELISAVRDLLSPAFAYELHIITGIHSDCLYLDSGAELHGSLLPVILARAKEVVAVVCTIGPHLERKVAEYFARRKPWRGLILDDIGLVALDSLTTEACHFMTREASSRGYQASGPLSPGMSGWPVDEQQHLVRLVPADKIGVRLTSQAMMVPRKTVSMVLGMGPDLPTWTQAEICGCCRLSGTCAYRIMFSPGAQDGAMLDGRG